MRKLLVGIVLIGAAFAAAFIAGQKRVVGAASLQKGSSFTPTVYPLENRPFVLVIAAHNNGAFVEKTLRSIFAQKYDNYRLVYIDDASNDGSFALAHDLIYELGDLSRVTIVQNEQRLGPFANLVRAVKGSSDHEIIVPVGAEDWLAHEWVLARLNQYYADPDLWLTLYDHREYPQYTKRHSGQIGAFQAALFKRLPDPDPNYLAALTEIGKDHTCRLEEILYIENRMQGAP